jgi:leucyl aminopeptidase
MLNCFKVGLTSDAIPIYFVTKENFNEWLKAQPVFIQDWLTTTQFRAESGCTSLIPNQTTGKLAAVLCGLNQENSFWEVGGLPLSLPEGNYILKNSAKLNNLYELAWGLGAYQFTRYKASPRKSACLNIAEAEAFEINNIVSAIYWVRDLINTPTEDMGPSELANVAKLFCEEFGGKFNEWVGDELLQQNFPLIHAVGRASDDPPRLLDLQFGNPKHRKITLVGKGVCFDSGGLDIKSASNMLLMKKDMGGAAHVLGLARMLLQANLPIALRVLLPAVENAVAGGAYRPGDVLKSRKGLTVEIGNTDAEGRLVLADALALSVEDAPELIIDIATLTGAARVALGTDVPAVFSNNDGIVDTLISHCNAQMDPIWRLPLYAPYKDSLKTPIADLNNTSLDGYAGAITAALFLNEFVSKEIPWIHLDLMAWNLKTRPGRPSGGEALALRGILSYLKANFNS